MKIIIKNKLTEKVIISSLINLKIVINYVTISTFLHQLYQVIYILKTTEDSFTDAEIAV